jgi:hypothetical protein
MNYTNVNIKSGDKSFKYIVEYLEENKKSSSIAKRDILTILLVYFSIMN